MRTQLLAARVGTARMQLRGGDDRRATRCARDVGDGHRADRSQGSYVRIERWTTVATGDVHWRTISGSNVLSVYGTQPATRISDPDDAKKVFRWLLELSLDDRGNAIVYEYKPEDNVGVATTTIYERNRHESPQAQRYLKRVRYGNRTMIARPTDTALPTLPTDAAAWMFEVVSDFNRPKQQLQHRFASPVATSPASPGNTLQQAWHQGGALNTTQAMGLRCKHWNVRAARSPRHPVQREATAHNAGGGTRRSSHQCGSVVPHRV
jgi:hypothetical protein